MGVARVGSDFSLAVRWTPFPLHPEVPEGGMELAELFRGRFDLAAAQERLRRTAAALGLPLAERTRTTNSRRAQELGEWAESEGRGEAFRSAVFHAYFAEGVNIGPEEEIVAVAARAGLDPNDAREVLRSGRFAGAVDAAWARCRRAGIDSVPTHRLDGRLLVGFRPSEELAKFVAGGEGIRG